MHCLKEAYLQQTALNQVVGGTSTVIGGTSTITLPDRMDAVYSDTGVRVCYKKVTTDRN